jgi:hypothetical protein
MSPIIGNGRRQPLGQKQTVLTLETSFQKSSKIDEWLLGGKDMPVRIGRPLSKFSDRRTTQG